MAGLRERRSEGGRCNSTNGYAVGRRGRSRDGLFKTLPYSANCAACRTDCYTGEGVRAEETRDAVTAARDAAPLLTRRRCGSAAYMANDAARCARWGSMYCKYVRVYEERSCAVVTVAQAQSLLIPLTQDQTPLLQVGFPCSRHIHQVHVFIERGSWWPGRKEWRVVSAVHCAARQDKYGLDLPGIPQVTEQQSHNEKASFAVSTVRTWSPTVT